MEKRRKLVQSRYMDHNPDLRSLSFEKNHVMRACLSEAALKIAA